MSSGKCKKMQKSESMVGKFLPLTPTFKLAAKRNCFNPGEIAPVCFDNVLRQCEQYLCHVM